MRMTRFFSRKWCRRRFCLVSESPALHTCTRQPLQSLPEQPVPSPGSFRPRQGRVRRYAGAIPLPTVWVECTPPHTFADHDFWKLPNTYPFLLIDTRAGYNEDGSPFSAHTKAPISPEELADNFLTVYEAYKSAFGDRFRALGKPMRFGVRLNGPDARSGDSPIRLASDPRDMVDRKRQRPWCLLSESFLGRSRGRMRRNRIMQGVTPKLGSEVPWNPTRSSFFHHHGRETTRAWAIPALNAVAAALKDNNLPFPELLVTSWEANDKDYRFGYPVYPYVEHGFPTYSSGWFDQLVRQWALQPQHHGPFMDGGLTFGEWMAQNQTTLSGEPIQQHDPNYFVVHPQENDLYWRMVAANQSAWRASQIYALFEPAKMAFGAQLKCGDWTRYSSGRLYPTEVRPGLFDYWRGPFGYDFQSPSNYQPGADQDETRPAGDTDPRWNLLDNWTGRLQLGGAGLSERIARWGLELHGSVDWGAARSAAASPFPSLTVNYLVRQGVFDQYRWLNTETALRAVLSGCRNIWEWDDPEFNANPDPITHPADAALAAACRDALSVQYAEINGRVAAMSARRNSVPRWGQSSFPKLAVNQP